MLPRRICSQGPGVWRTRNWWQGNDSAENRCYVAGLATPWQLDNSHATTALNLVTTICDATGLTTRLLVVIALTSVLFGCSSRNAYVPPPPPEVVVASAEQRSVTVYHYYTGTTQASDAVEVRSRVAGYLDSIFFQDGTNVTQGQRLFVVDQRPYVALLDQASAQLESRKATATQQESVYKRDLALLPSKAVTQEQVDIDRGNWLVAQATVLEAEAAVRQAQLNMNYTEIHAPIGGRVGRRLVDVGNLVSSDVTLLTTIMRYDPMYVYFTVSEANYLDYLRRQREKAQHPLPSSQPTNSSTGASSSGSNDNNNNQRTPLELGLGNETGYPHRGYIDFSESTVDPSTGTLLLRGVFANPEPYYMAPGLFVRIRVPIGTHPDALLVPDSALGTDQAGRYLLMVPSSNVVERRSVTVGELQAGMRVIEQGLKPGEQFITEGLQRARPGIKVSPVRAGARQGSESPAGAPSGTPSKATPPGGTQPGGSPSSGTGASPAAGQPSPPPTTTPQGKSSPSAAPRSRSGGG